MKTTAAPVRAPTSSPTHARSNSRGTGRGNSLARANPAHDASRGGLAWNSGRCERCRLDAHLLRVVTSVVDGCAVSRRFFALIVSCVAVRGERAIGAARRASVRRSVGGVARDAAAWQPFARRAPLRRSAGSAHRRPGPEEAAPPLFHCGVNFMIDPPHRRRWNPRPSLPNRRLWSPSPRSSVGLSRSQDQGSAAIDRRCHNCAIRAVGSLIRPVKASRLERDPPRLNAGRGDRSRGAPVDRDADDRLLRLVQVTDVTRGHDETSEMDETGTWWLTPLPIREAFAERVP
jgi:hypothetical protein